MAAVMAQPSPDRRFPPPALRSPLPCSHCPLLSTTAAAAWLPPPAPPPLFPTPPPPGLPPGLGLAQRLGDGGVSACTVQLLAAMVLWAQPAICNVSGVHAGQRRQCGVRLFQRCFGVVSFNPKWGSSTSQRVCWGPIGSAHDPRGLSPSWRREKMSHTLTSRRAGEWEACFGVEDRLIGKGLSRPLSTCQA